MPPAHQVACMKMVRGVPNADELRRLGRSRRAQRVRRGAGWGGSAAVGCPDHSGDMAPDDGCLTGRPYEDSKVEFTSDSMKECSVS